MAATWCREYFSFYPHALDRHTLIGRRHGCTHSENEPTLTGAHTCLISENVYYRVPSLNQAHRTRYTVNISSVISICIHSRSHGNKKKQTTHYTRTRPRPKHFWDPYCSLNTLKVVPFCARTCLWSLYYYATASWLAVSANHCADTAELLTVAHISNHLPLEWALHCANLINKNFYLKSKFCYWKNRTRTRVCVCLFIYLLHFFYNCYKLSRNAFFIIKCLT